MVISFFVTGQLVMAITIGSIEIVTKNVLYYLHEPAWEGVTKFEKNEPDKEFA
jgi:uncharacterized membrane protein